MNPISRPFLRDGNCIYQLNTHGSNYVTIHVTKGHTDDMGRLTEGELNKITDFVARAVNSHDTLVEALRQIIKGEGRFSEDPFEHAVNTIEDMQQLAVNALAQAEKGA